MEIPFKIIEMEESGPNRIGVKIEYTNPDSSKIENHVFSFKSEKFKEDAFMETIQETLDTMFDTSVKINRKKYIGKTFYHKVKKKSKVI